MKILTLIGAGVGIWFAVSAVAAHFVSAWLSKDVDRG